MKRLLLLGIALLSVVACTRDNIDNTPVVSSIKSFNVKFEASDATRVQLQNGSQTVWTKGDVVSVFNQGYVNQKYMFNGNTGDSKGTIVQMNNDELDSPVSNKRVVMYPYSESYRVLYGKGYVEMSLPQVQHYVPGSFGMDGCPMIGVSKNNEFAMRNICGWLRIDLRGEAQRVRKISVQSYQQCAGTIYVNMDSAEVGYDILYNNDDLNSVGYENDNIGGYFSDIYTAVELDCGEEGVMLGNDVTSFYVALPPQTYNNVKVVIDVIDEAQMILEANNPVEIKRNHITPMHDLTANEAMIKTGYYAIRQIINAMLKPTDYMWDHSDFGFPSVGVHNDQAAQVVVTNGWAMGYNPYYNRFQTSASCMGYDVNGTMPIHYWYSYYPIIELCNKTIEAYKEFDYMAEVVAAARIYRAMLYIDLARIFEFLPTEYHQNVGVEGLTVPIVTEDTTKDEAQNNPRATREDMFKFIFSDLAAAERVLAAGGAIVDMPGMPVVYGLYARAYMWLGGFNDGRNGELPEGNAAYQKAAEYARKAIDEFGGAVMTEDEWTNITTGFNTKASSWMWTLTYTTDSITSNLHQFTAHMSPEAAYGYTPFSHPGVGSKYYDILGDNDFRKKLIIAPDWSNWDEFKNYTQMSYDEYQSFAPYTFFKFRPAQGERTDFLVAAAITTPLMRCEEMYFIEMEAVYHTQGKDVGFNKFSQFMLNYRDPNLTCKSTDYLDLIIKHKAIEFWGEGIIMYDMKRLNMGVHCGYEGTNYDGYRRFNTNGRLPWWTPMIPQIAIDNNHALEDQNNPDPSNLVQLWNEWYN